MSDWTRGDDPVYDGYRQYWQAQAEAEYEADRAEEEERQDIMAGILTARLRELADADRKGKIKIGPDWTPCSDGLPEDREWILVTMKEPYCKPRVASCIVVFDAMHHEYFPLGEIGNQDERIYGVIAWQKFNPEPYNHDRKEGAKDGMD